MKIPATDWFTAFVALAAFHLAAMLFQWQSLTFYSKPLLLIFLALHFFRKARPLTQIWKRLMLLGLIFSAVGDTLMLFAGKRYTGDLFFLGGLSAFLITQVCYAFVFQKIRKAAGKAISLKIGSFVLPVLFVMGLLIILWPGIPHEMRIPVAVYALGIFSMFVSALQWWNSQPHFATRLVLAGALLFLVSDSLIALHKFRADTVSLPLAPLWIMLTYWTAQGLIVTGVLSKK